MSAELPSASAPAAPPRTRRGLLAAVVAAGVLLHASSIGAGFHADDHVHQLALDGRLPLRPWALFDFGTTDDWRHLADGQGGFPWWTSPDWAIRFFRPVSSLSHVLDRAVFGAWAPGHHLVSLAWLAVMFLVAHAALRAVGVARGTAIGAVALLASSQATTYPAEWIANRNALLATTFTAAAVWAIASHARLGRARSLGLALASSLAAALSKESGAASFGVVAAWLVIADHGLPRGWSLRAAGAAAGCGAAYVAALALSGFGTRSDFYATPWSDPARYVAHLATMCSTGLLAVFTPVPSDITFVLPDSAGAFAVAGLVVGIPCIAWMARRLRGDRTCAFLAAWAGIVVLPEAGAPMQDRLLLGAGIGLSALLATLVARTVPRSAGRGTPERIAAWTLVAFASLEVLVTFGQSSTLAQMARTTREKVLATDVGDASLGRRDVFVLQGDDPLVVFAMPGTWAWNSSDAGVRFTALQMGRRALRWSRIDERTMEFESRGAPFVALPFEKVYRSGAAPAPRGTTSDVGPMRFEITGCDADGAARTVRVTFRDPPDGDRFRFVAPKDGRLVRVEPPRPGETIDVPEAPKAHPFVP